MNVKKTLIFVLIFLLFIQVVRYLNKQADSALFDDYYTEDFDDGSDSRSAWDKISEYFSEHFEDFFKEKEDLYLER